MNNDSLELIKQQYFTLETNFNDLFNACDTEAQKDELRRDYVNARNNLWQARNLVFAEDDPMVANLRDEISQGQSQIDASIQDLQNVAGTLSAITAAVRLASSLVSLASHG